MSATPSPAPTSRWWGVVRVGLGLLAAGWAVWKLIAASQAAPFPALRPGFGPLTLAVAVSIAALAWFLVLSGLGVRAAGLPEPMPARFWTRWWRLWSVTYFYRWVPGKVLLVAERARLGAFLGLPAATGVVLVIWESGLYLAGAGVFGAAGLLSTPLPPEAPVSREMVAALAVVSALGCLLLGPVLRLASRLVPAVAAKLPGLALEVSPARQAGLVAAYAGGWAALGLSFWTTARCFEGSDGIGAGSLAFWFVVSYVVGQVASITPAGLGVREVVLVAALEGAVGSSTILAWAVANRIVLMVAEAVLLLGSLTVRMEEPE